MFPVAVRWILHEGHVALLDVGCQRRSADIQKGTDDLGFGVQTSKPARTGVAKNPHEDGFDLVVEVVGSYNFCSLLRCDLLEELPTAATPFFLARSNGRWAARDAGESAAECLSRDKRCRSSRGLARAVINGRNGDLLACARVKSGCGGQQRHRIEAARDREYGRAPGPPRPPPCAPPPQS